MVFANNSPESTSWWGQKTKLLPETLCFILIQDWSFLNILVRYFNCSAQRGVLVDFPENSNQNTTSKVLRVLGRCTENAIPDDNRNPYMECYKNGSSEIVGGCKCIEGYLMINSYCKVRRWFLRSIYSSIKAFMNMSISFRSSHHRCSIKKVSLKISQNSQENTCARVSFLIKLQGRGPQLY